jgi:hypothetical protein
MVPVKTETEETLAWLPMELNLARRTELWAAIARDGAFHADDGRGRHITYTTSTAQAFTWRTRDILGALFEIWQKQGGKVSTNALLEVETSIYEIIKLLGYTYSKATWDEVFNHLATLSKTFFLIFEEFYDPTETKRKAKKTIKSYSLFTKFELYEGSGQIKFILSPLFAASLSNMPQYIPKLPSSATKLPATRHLAAYISSNKGFTRNGKKEWRLNEFTALAVMGIKDSNSRRAKQKAFKAAEEVAKLLGMELEIQEIDKPVKNGNKWQIVLKQEITKITPLKS